MIDPNPFKTKVKDMILDPNLILLGNTDLKVGSSFQLFQTWLKQNKHAEMAFLENYQEIRQDPKKLMDHAESALVFGYKYSLQHKTKTSPPQTGRIASYALLKDYHRFLKKILNTLFEKLNLDPEQPSFEFRVLVDSAPVLERALAHKTHFGFIGKNTFYIHPDHGSAMLIAIVVVDLKLEPEQKAKIEPTERTELGGCGSCKRCQVFCPTGALDEEYRLDARKCISYWTIEHRGVVPKDKWFMFEDYVFGCDICQNICPYNRNLPEATSPHEVKPSYKNMDLATLASLSQEQYEKTFGGTPVTRAKRHGLQRNALIAMYQKKDARLESLAKNINQFSDHEVVLKTAKQVLELLSSKSLGH